MWRDVFGKVISFFHRLFAFMESEGILDPSSTLHLCVLHLVFLPLINKALQEFTSAWNNHGIRIANKSPSRMFLPHCAAWRTDRPPLEPVIDDMQHYGVDWQGPVPFADQDVRLPRMPSPLDDHQLTTIRNTVDFNRPSQSLHVDAFLEALALARTMVPPNDTNT